MASVLVSSSGGGQCIKYAAKAIRLARYGCSNRPFFHIVIIMKGRNQHQHPIEQVGTYDPMPNSCNEKLISLNMERIRYWIGEGCEVSTPVAELLGLSGFLPMHPRSYMTAWRNRHTRNPPYEKENEEVGIEKSGTFDTYEYKIIYKGKVIQFAHKLDTLDYMN